MDVERFIPCLIKTVSHYAEKARAHFEANKSIFEKMNYLPERLCPDGRRYNIHGLYGTSVEFRYDDFFIHTLAEKPSAISITVSFEMHGFQHDFRVSSLDDTERVKEKINHHFYVRAMNVNRYLEEIESIRDFLSSNTN